MVFPGRYTVDKKISQEKVYKIFPPEIIYIDPQGYERQKYLY